MITLILGFLFLAVSVGLGFDLKSVELYYNAHAIFIVVGGSAALFLFCNPLSTTVGVIKSIKKLFEKEHDIESVRRELQELSETKHLTHPSQDAMIQYAAELWEQGISPDMFIVLLSQHRSRLENLFLESTNALRNLAKYPPALGMTGTVMGLVSLFSELGSDSKDKIGPALAVAMTATFFGLIVAHAIIMPLSDRLHVMHIKHKAYYAALYEVLLLINRQEATELIAQEVRYREEAA